MKFLFIVDPLANFELAGDTSYALMLETARQGHEVYTCQPGHLGLEIDDCVARVQKTDVKDAATSDLAFTLDEPKNLSLSTFDGVWIRQDPPFNVEYLQTTWILEHAREKTLLVNDPRGLRELNEHLAILRVPDLTPPTIVTRDSERLRGFLNEQGGAIVVKPVDGFGGRGVFVVKQDDPNRGAIFESSTAAGAEWTMAQTYLPAASEGDKRIILCDGEFMGAVLRVPPKTEARGNLHVGGSAVKTELTAREKVIIDRVRPLLKDNGIVFAGIDVIGGMLTEINITSPTGIRQISSLEQRNAAEPIIQAIVAKIKRGI